MNECIFCKIIAGELPSSMVYEDEHTVAFLSKPRLVNGHTLVVPKKHCADFSTADPECLKSVLATTQMIVKGVLKATGADGCNVSTNNGAAAGQTIFHLHWHIVPRFENDGFTSWPHSVYADGEAEKTAEKICQSLE